jgi:DNA-binding MarR family transcriptional regulator
MPSSRQKPARARRHAPPADRQAADGDPLDRLIWYLGRAYYTYVGLLERVLVEVGLDRHVRPGMGHVLFTLFEQDDCSIKEIAARSQLACSTLTGLLTRMESGGLIERRRDDTDGRLVRVRLTNLGRSLEPRCRQVVERLDGVFLDGMGEPAMHQAKQLLQQMIVTMRREEKAVGAVP